MTQNLSKLSLNHLGSLIVLILIVCLLCLVAKLTFRKKDLEAKPSRLQVFLEGIVGGFDSFFRSSSGGRFSKAKPYIFGLASFIVIGNLLPLIGFEPITISYTTTFILALITWLGIFVVGFIFRGKSYFRSLLNPLDLFGKIPLVISLSFRLFGNILGGTIVIFLIYLGTFQLQNLIIASSLLYTQVPNFVSILILPFFRLYFDVFAGLLQAFIFVLLTINYWNLEAESGASDAKKAKS